MLFYTSFSRCYCCHLPETCVNKDEGKEEGREGEDRLYCGNWVKSVIDVSLNKEQLPNLESRSWSDCPMELKNTKIYLEYLN